MKNKLSVEEQWHMVVVEGRTFSAERERLAKFYALLPAGSRCRFCNLPFTGLSGQIMHSLGKTPSNVNPHLCNACDSFFRMNPGGVEIHLSMLFADIRGSTGLAEHMKPAEYSKVIHRFFAAATDALCNHDALIDKLAGDQVSGYFVPGLAGPDHARAAVQAAQELLQVTGHFEPAGPWIPMGIGVHTGEAFIGSVGTQGGIFDMTALGDAVNIAARLASVAEPGELLVSQETYTEAGLTSGIKERRQIELKGRSGLVSVVVL